MDSTRTTSGQQVRGDSAQSCPTAAVSGAIPRMAVTHCAVCGYVGLDLAQLTCGRDSSHGVMGEASMTAPEIAARWILSGQDGEGYQTPAAVAAGCDIGGHDYDASGTCEDCGHSR